jgi:hypothetical protein
MKSVIKIPVSNKAKNFLISREVVFSLFDKLSKFDSDLELDFSNIEFISSSYADQFHKAKNDFENKHNSKIHILNANEKVIRMFQVVSKTQNSHERLFEKIPVYKFSKIDSLSDYLLSI